jgi:hypothetical protein
MTTPRSYTVEYSDLLGLLKKLNKRIITEGPALRAQMKSLDPGEEANIKYVDTIAALGIQRNCMRLEAESYYSLMNPAEKKSVTAPDWGEPKIS